MSSFSRWANRRYLYPLAFLGGFVAMCSLCSFLGLILDFIQKS